MKKITPFLWFDHQAEEAAKFYLSVFRGGRILEIMRSPEGLPVPAGSVLTVRFRVLDQEIVALNGGPHFKFNESMSLCVECRTQREIDRYWRLLTAAGGEPSCCGWLCDRYGLSWQIVPAALSDLLGGKDAARSGRVARALMKMTKINLRKLQQAAGRK